MHVPYTSLTGADLSHNVAAALKTCQYTTGMVGKWHLTPGSETGGSYSDAYSTQQERVKARGFDYADGLYVGNLNTCTTACRQSKGVRV